MARNATTDADGTNLSFPAFATAHSHAFQRALRFQTERAGEPGSFWSWRDKMYSLAQSLCPESIYDLSRLAFAELAMSGVAAVGEFHYVHHQPDGTPYEDRTIMADAVIRAARDVGIQIALLRVLYHRGGHGIAAGPHQERFCDPDVETVVSDAEKLASRFASDSGVAVGLAPHSIRAVPGNWISAANNVAREKKWPLHMHVAEQKRELEECVKEYGQTPVAWLADNGVLGAHFTAVHATHLTEGEVTMLGKSGSSVCVCRTTERNLGDGLCNARGLFAAGARICVGTDSHSSSDAFEEMRAIELDERSRTESRCVAADADALLLAGTQNGYRSIFLDGSKDRLQLHKGVSIAGANEKSMTDALVFAGHSGLVERLSVQGKTVVKDGEVENLSEIVTRYEARLREIFS